MLKGNVGAALAANSLVVSANGTATEHPNSPCDFHTWVSRSRWLFAITALLPLTAPAQDDELKEVELTVKPLLCIVDQRTPSCDMSFRVTWRSTQEGYYCVTCDLDEQPLRCWAEQNAGELNDERSVLQDFSYMINGGVDQPPLDAVTVEVVRMDSDDRRRRRRTRHVWDIT